jgi:hypothetical protein
MPIHNSSVLLSALARGTTAPVSNVTETVNASACAAGDCVPDGFWALMVTSVVILIAMISLLSWAASPVRCGACCCSVKRGVGDIWRGARQVLLESSGRQQSEDGLRSQRRNATMTQDGEIEEEDWWIVQPQTEREMTVFAAQQEGADGKKDE